MPCHTTASTIALRHDASQGDSARSAEITGTGKAAAVVARLRALRDFLAEAGHSKSRRERMAGDASDPFLRAAP